MSKRTVSVALLLVALSTPAFAASSDDRDPGIASRISRILARIVRVLAPQDDLSWPHP